LISVCILISLFLCLFFKQINVDDLLSPWNARVQISRRYILKNYCTLFIPAEIENYFIYACHFRHYHCYYYFFKSYFKQMLFTGVYKLTKEMFYFLPLYRCLVSRRPRVCYWVHREPSVGYISHYTDVYHIAGRCPGIRQHLGAFDRSRTDHSPRATTPPVVISGFPASITHTRSRKRY